MHRFLVDNLETDLNEVTITGEEGVHLYRVLRLRPGAIIEVGDGRGRAFRAELISAGPQSSKARLLEPILEEREPRLPLILAQALVKGEKMDWIIQKGTELGVHTFVPFTSRRVVVKLKGEKAAARRERWERIAREAAKQCGRTLVPRVDGPLDLEEVLTRYGREDYLIILPWEGENNQGLNVALTGVSRRAGVVVVIGPEGGFEEEEVQRAQELGARVVSLGPRILRAETAALAVVTMTLFAAGDLGTSGGAADYVPG
ncbi:MAG: 16S rRNA (uracil(1498)-N(3))-methyltransferase [bacterium]|jgi:16S rRNA (uracil1498-N3)-methyltransferase|nr:16S rRNA (uracil(1498)-N(3))-methyltransferase [Bacillota bacterium]